MPRGLLVVVKCRSIMKASFIHPRRYANVRKSAQYIRWLYCFPGMDSFEANVRVRRTIRTFRFIPHSNRADQKTTVIFRDLFLLIYPGVSNEKRSLSRHAMAETMVPTLRFHWTILVSRNWSLQFRMTTVSRIASTLMLVLRSSSFVRAKFYRCISNSGFYPSLPFQTYRRDVKLSRWIDVVVFGPNPGFCFLISL
ncbi:hypothetical protein ABKN59_003505 [Abortiporus biennis]